MLIDILSKEKFLLYICIISFVLFTTDIFCWSGKTAAAKFNGLLWDHTNPRAAQRDEP
jgi:hypothetical protein